MNEWIYDMSLCFYLCTIIDIWICILWIYDMSHNNIICILFRLFLLIYKEYLMRSRSSSSVFNHTLGELLNVHHHTSANNSDNIDNNNYNNCSCTTTTSTTTTTTINQKRNDVYIDNQKAASKNSNQQRQQQQQQHLLSLFSYYQSVVKQSVWLYASDKYFLQLFYEIQLQNGDCNQANLISWRMNKV